MAVHRERVDPAAQAPQGVLAHRRWILPDDPARPVELPGLARLWRGLLELGLLNPGEEVTLERLALPPAPGAATERQGLPAQASSGALFTAGENALLLTQVVWLRKQERRDPYAEDEDGVGGWRDYTIYFCGHPGFLLLPIRPLAFLCHGCGQESEPGLPPFGEAFLLDLQRSCPSCKAAVDRSRDKVRLRSGALFLLEEACAHAALSIELPEAPEAEELPDAEVAALVRSAFGDTDELADDRVPAAQ
jgi:hypothetical protein